MTSQILNSQTSGKISKANLNKDENFEFQNELSRASAKFGLKDMKIDEFRRNLSTLGAFKFMAYMNELRLEDRINLKRIELEKRLGLDSEGIKDKSEKEIRELKFVLEDMLWEFKSRLMKKSEDNALLQKQQRLSKQSPLSLALSSVLDKF